MNFRKVQQISENHCGPAVIEMLLDAIGIEHTQEAIAQAGGVDDEILEEHGMRVDQLALACSTLAPDAQFWYKYNSSIEDVQYLLDKGYAVGVEWQGLFYENEEDEEDDEDQDFGHYSIISHVDEELDQLIIVDPYRYFAKQDRIIPIPFFLTRWWDTNEVRDPNTGRLRLVTDDKLLFFITPAGEFFHREQGYKAFSRVE